MHYKEIRRGLRRTIRHKPYVVDDPYIEIVAHLEPEDMGVINEICDEINQDLHVLMDEEVAYLRAKFEEEENVRIQNQNK